MKLEQIKKQLITKTINNGIEWLFEQISTRELRNAMICDLKKTTKLKNSQIGIKFGISRQAVDKICKKCTM